MNKKLLIGVIAVVLVIVLFVSFGRKTVTKTGSVMDGQAYLATTTYNHLAAPNFLGIQQLKSTPGVLGSIVITGTGASTMRFYDATSSTDVSSTSLAMVPASTAVGTYVYDVQFGRGLILESTPTSIPTSTITTR